MQLRAQTETKRKSKRFKKVRSFPPEKGHVHNGQRAPIYSFLVTLALCIMTESC
jgi:hypothetical protein